MMEIAGGISTGPGEPDLVMEYLEGEDGDSWKKVVAEGLSGEREKGTLREGSESQGTVPSKTCLIGEIERAADSRVEGYKSRLDTEGYTTFRGGFRQNFRPRSPFRFYAERLRCVKVEKVVPPSPRYINVYQAYWCLPVCLATTSRKPVAPSRQLEATFA